MKCFLVDSSDNEAGSEQTTVLIASDEQKLKSRLATVTHFSTRM
jgi:hypothetical protein